MKPTPFVGTPRLSPLAIVATIFSMLMQAVAQTPTPTASPVPDQSVAFQNNVQHDGNDPSSPLMTPLALKWKHDFGSNGAASFPIH